MVVVGASDVALEVGSTTLDTDCVTVRVEDEGDVDEDNGAVVVVAARVDDDAPLPLSTCSASSGSLHPIVTPSVLAMGSATQICRPSHGTVWYLPAAAQTPCVRGPRQATLPGTHGESGVSAAKAALSCLA